MSVTDRDTATTNSKNLSSLLRDVTACSLDFLIVFYFWGQRLF